MSDIDFELGPTCEAVVKANQRITPPTSDEVRHLVLHVGDPAFRFLEGQTIGVVVPGPTPSVTGTPAPLLRANARQLAAERAWTSRSCPPCFYVDDVSGEHTRHRLELPLRRGARHPHHPFRPYRSAFRMPPGRMPTW